MKFSLSLLSTLAALVSAVPHVEQDHSTPALFDLRIDNVSTVIPELIWNTLMFANGTLYVGDIKYTGHAQPFLLTGGSQQYGHTFTAFYSSPTGWQNFYVRGNETAQIGFTTPHSAYRPPNAIETGFGSYKGLLKLKVGEEVKSNWVACKVPESVGRNTWGIWWVGGEEKEGCVDVELRIKAREECRM